MTITINITNASNINSDGQQTIVFDVVYKGNTIVTNTMTEDVDNLKDNVLDFVMRYKEKYSSVNKYNTGDSFELEV